MPFWLLLKGLFAPAKMMAAASAVFQFVAKNWKQLAIAAMIGLIFYQNFIEHRFVFGMNTIPHLQSKIVELEQELEVSRSNFEICQKGNQRLEEAIKQQNEQIAVLGDLTKQFDERFGELNDTLDNMRRDTNQTVQDILNAPTPETCEAALDYLRQAAQEGFVW
jgi:DNA anti-recombination protein RmuC